MRFLSLCVEFNRTKLKDHYYTLDHQESQWMDFLVDIMGNLPTTTPMHSIARENWTLCLLDVEFKDWKMLQRKWILFFDGASKENLRVAIGGGIVLDPNGIQEIKYA